MSLGDEPVRAYVRNPRLYQTIAVRTHALSVRSNPIVHSHEINVTCNERIGQ